MAAGSNDRLAKYGVELDPQLFERCDPLADLGELSDLYLVNGALFTVNHQLLLLPLSNDEDPLSNDDEPLS